MNDKLKQDLQANLAGKFEIVKKIGSGSMASVYLAKEIALDREVVIKTLYPRFLNDVQFIARFRREAKLAANLEHPSIVRIYQISDDDKLCYFVMNHIPCGSLREQIKESGILPFDKVLLWSRDILSALNYAHERGIIHRDLKPDNILIDKNTRAVVMDFGIARAAQDPHLTLQGLILGTPNYISPEQAQGLEADERSDIYSFGVILYEMATGRLPFIGDDIKTLLKKHIMEEPKQPLAYNKEIPQWLNNAIMKCLQKRPENRFSSASELRGFILDHEQTQEIPAVATPIVEEVPFVRPHRRWNPTLWKDLPHHKISTVSQALDDVKKLPTHTQKLLQAVMDEGSSAKDIAQIAYTDPALVTAILRIVNSSYYGLSQKTSNLHFAMAFLGMNEIRRIVLHICMNTYWNREWEHRNYSTKGLWLHSYQVSVCAEYLAKRVDPKRTGSYITLGLLHDVGKYFLFYLIRTLENGRKIPPVPKSSTTLEKEEAIFTINHTIAGKILAERWGFPEQISRVIEHHHNPSFFDIDSIPQSCLRETIVINIADLLVRRITRNEQGLEEPEAEYFELIDLPPSLDSLATDDLISRVEQVKQIAGS